MIILLTGGLGYIGSHCAIELLVTNHDIIIVDNLSNSKIQVLESIKYITKKEIVFYQIDLLKTNDLEQVFINHKIDAVIHLAGLKSVTESISHSFWYYQHNIGITFNLISLMDKYGIKKLIFSSSATVYGSHKSPVDETMITGQNLSNPYAKTKYMIESILTDLIKSDPSWSIVILRYFNPSGAHQSGLLSEDPNGIPID